MIDKQIIDRVIKIYKNELTYYQNLLSLSQKQQKLIKNSDLEELERILSSKEQVMSKIDDLELKLKPYKNACIKALDLDDKRWISQLLETELFDLELEDTINSIKTLIKELNDLDKQNQKLMADKKNELMKEIGKIRKGSKVNKSYNSKQARIHSTFIDNKS
ncbi:flagellar protein FlgN [Orenia marismortui]|uniref:flagellar protein FlgN n=1 Tax=Orenia marismortui TaxID=46469 RepID=UPI000382912A|nr:flagellar protein FlgN [Orenia marismortui]